MAAVESKKKTGNGMVRVACKLPHGLNVRMPDGRTIELNGLHSRQTVAGHGMTYIPAKDWDAIQVVYAEAKWLRNEHVFAFADADDAAAMAEEREQVNAGFNPIDPKNPGIHGGVTIQREGAKDPNAE